MSALEYTTGRRLGVGGFGMVFEAQSPDGHVVAIKQTRTSRQVKNTWLQHEAKIMMLLSGSRYVPQVLGYLRVPHFEYLAIELLGQTLTAALCRNVGKFEGQVGFPVPTVAWIAVQMLSALEHLASHGIVHRDIKPDNMLLSLDSPPRLLLCDYGLSTISSRKLKPTKISRNATGTLIFASLYAHRHSDLNTADDLESLAYSLFFLLYNSLPWSSIKTTRSKNLEILNIKKDYTGYHFERPGIPTLFGQFLDFSRRVLVTMDDLKYFKIMFEALMDLVVDWEPVAREALFLMALESGLYDTTRSGTGEKVPVFLLDTASRLSVLPEWNDMVQGELVANMLLPPEMDKAAAAKLPLLKSVIDGDPWEW